MADFVKLLIDHGPSWEFPWSKHLGKTLPFGVDEVFQYVLEKKLESAFVDAHWPGSDGIYLICTGTQQYELFDAERGIHINSKTYPDLRVAVKAKLIKILEQLQDILEF